LSLNKNLIQGLNELPATDGLGQVQGSAQGRSQFFPFDHRADNNGYRPGVGMLMQIGQQFPPIDIGEHHVQHNNMRSQVRHSFKKTFPLRQVDDVIAGVGGVIAIEVDQVKVIVYHQHRDLLIRRQQSDFENEAMVANADFK